MSILNPHVGDSLSVPIDALQVRLLRTKPAGQESRVILVTSTLPGEGKTTVSFNLAASLAQSGKRVILVDADLRHQVIKARCGITTPSAGLLELSRAAKPECRQSSHLGAEHQPASPRRRYQNGLPHGKSWIRPK